MSSSKPKATPFLDLTADIVVILRTSDGVDFQAHKSVLSIASPVFEGMFSINQPASDLALHDKNPIIEISEQSEVIEALLRLCYPVQEPDLSSVAKITPVVAAAYKYEMESIMSRLKVPLRAFVTSSPLEVFALACRHHLEEIAREAAEAWSTLR